jgi:hypothetical protein
MRIHLDTDLDSDTDDACALAMLLGWPGVELVGITTAVDPGGRRAGYVAHGLQLAGRDDIPVAAGAEASLTTLGRPGSIPDAPRYWPARVPPRPSPAGAALDLLERNEGHHRARPSDAGRGCLMWHQGGSAGSSGDPATWSATQAPQRPGRADGRIASGLQLQLGVELRPQQHRGGAQNSQTINTMTPKKAP